MSKTTYKLNIGCFIDGANQNQTEGDARSVRLSESMGRVLDAATLAYCERVENDEPSEDDIEDSNAYSQEAEDWLNENHSLPFASWCWDDGNFGLWPNLDGAKEDCGFTSSRKQEYPDDDYEGEWLHVNDHGNCTLYVRTAGKDVEAWSLV